MGSHRCLFFENTLSSDPATSTPAQPAPWEAERNHLVTPDFLMKNLRHGEVKALAAEVTELVTGHGGDREITL